MNMILELIKDLLAQVRTGFKRLLLLFLVAAVPIAVVVFSRVFLDVPVAYLTKDIAALGELTAYAGLLSQIGLIMWGSAAAVLIFTMIHFYDRILEGGTRAFFISSIAVTLILFLDDGFMLHESFFPSIGIPEKAAYLSYLVALLVYLTVFVKRILETEYVLLLLALAFFALSMMIDVLSGFGFTSIILEDSTKFAGIVAWMFYYWRVSYATIRGE